MSEYGKMRVALLDRINKHPGKRIMDALQAYASTNEVFAGNGLELRELIRALEDVADPLKIGAIQQRPKLQALFGEVFRLFHNFLASVKTLIDHTRNLMKKDFVGPEHRSEHQLNVQHVFVTDPLSRFMQDFRHYVLHVAVPKMELTNFIAPAPQRLELRIDAVDMLRWEKWNSLARKYLEQHKPKLRILSVVDDYEIKVQEFHENFVIRFQHHCATEMGGVIALMNEWNEGIKA